MPPSSSRARPEIRSARPDDADAIEACVAAAFGPWIPVLGTRPAPMLEDYRAVLFARQVFVAEIGAQLVGVLVLANGADGFMLETVAVHPSVAGKGLGHILLALAEREAVAQGHSSITLVTHAKMTRNVALYERAGYQRVGERNEGPFARVYMRKQLGSRDYQGREP
ncbi:MAG: GNAT family N-acetyltransferase [Burkholderiaceae bacterium]